jgi:chromosome segregation ATPase
MEIDKKDIIEVGEAVEALGVMMERELQKINLQLNQLIKFISDNISQEKTFKEEIGELRNQIQKTGGLLERLEAAVSRTESRISELQTVFQDEEDITAEIRNDLLIIKRDLQFVRSDLKDFLDHREHLDKKLKDFENRIDGLEKERFV